MSQEETDYAWLDEELEKVRSAAWSSGWNNPSDETLEQAKTSIQAHLTAQLDKQLIEQESKRQKDISDAEVHHLKVFEIQAKQHQVELVLARIDEIYKLKRSGVTDAIGLYAYQVDKLDFDDRIKQLQAELDKLENKQ